MILTVQKRARELLDRAGVAKGARALIGCSGGPDSTVIADVAAAMAAEGRLGHVTLLYVDHGLREEAAAEAEVVRALAASLSSRARVDARVEAVTVDRARASLEGAAREARYACFARVASELVAGVVLLGHTASDQAETVLMRVVRGTGVAGLAGIPERRGIYVRPLLTSTRVDIETYLAERGHQVNRDPMNRDSAFFRVRVRHDILPTLREENPKVDDALVRLAAAAREQREVLDYAARQLVGSRERGQPLVISVDALSNAPDAVAKRVILLASRELTATEIAANHLDAVLGLARQDASGSKSLDLPRLRVTREYGSLRLENPAARAPGRAPLAISGPDGPYQVRDWLPGDRMRPERLKGRSRKLSDLFADEKIPRRVRATARVVLRATDGVIVWAEHLGRAVDSRIEVRLTGADPLASNKC